MPFRHSPRPFRWLWRVLSQVVGAAVLFASVTPDALAPGTSERCPVNAKLVPACGALWGITPPDPSYLSLQRAEEAVGRKFDFVYRFHDVNDQIPDAEDRAILDTGALMHIAIDPRNYSRPDLPALRWADIAAGAADTQLWAQARGVASIGRPVFVTFDHEPDLARKAGLGTSNEYKEAWRHVYHLFQEAHASNAVWVWVVTGGMSTASTALSMWPGNDVVDWLSWEGYDFAGCQTGAPDIAVSQTFSSAVLPFYTYLHANGRAAGIDVEKPIMISEAGTAIASSATQFPGWYQEIPRFLSQYPQIRAVGLWDHGDRVATCNFQFSTIPDRAEDVRRAGRAKWVNPLATAS